MAYVLYIDTNRVKRLYLGDRLLDDYEAVVDLTYSLYSPILDTQSFGDAYALYSPILDTQSFAGNYTLYSSVKSYT